MTTYFVSQKVCSTLNMRNASSVFKTHGLIEGRDYIKFSQKMNPVAFKRLLDANLIDKHSTLTYLLTVSGVLEVLFKSKSPDAINIKDAIIKNDSYKLYNSHAYKMVDKIVNSLTPLKRTKFYDEEAFAIKVVTEVVGTMSDELIRSIAMIRSFASGKVDHSNTSIEPLGLEVLLNTFSNFSM